MNHMFGQKKTCVKHLSLIIISSFISIIISQPPMSEQMAKQTIITMF